MTYISRSRAQEDLKQSLITERDHRMTALHQQENELNSLRLRMAQVEVKLDRKLALEEGVEEHTAEVATCEGRIEVGVTLTRVTAANALPDTTRQKD